MITAADDPEVIAAGGLDNFHIVGLNDGYHSYVSDNVAAQSSGGVAPTGKIVDLVASDWFGGETDCAPLINGCTDDYPIEAAAGTSGAAPLIAAADVIQAYRDTHNGASPTPAMIKDILTSTATDIDAPTSGTETAGRWSVAGGRRAGGSSRSPRPAAGKGVTREAGAGRAGPCAAGQAGRCSSA